MNKLQLDGQWEQASFFPASYSGPQILDFTRPPPLVVPSDDSTNQNPPYHPAISDPDPQEVPDYYEACLGYIRDMLMEEDLDGDLITVPNHGAALEATEKSFYDALGQSCYDPSTTVSAQYYSLLSSPGTDETAAGPHSFSNGNESGGGGSYGCTIDGFVESRWSSNNLNQFQQVAATFDYFDDGSQYYSHSRAVEDELVTRKNWVDSSSCSPASMMERSSSSSVTVSEEKEETRINRAAAVMDQKTSSRRVHQRDDGEIVDHHHEERRNNKQAASYIEESVSMEKYDEVLLNKEDSNTTSTASSNSETANSKSKSRRNRGSKKRNNNGSSSATVDLRTLLTHCAQAVSSFDLITANDQLKQIREHASPHGNSLERVSHYFANALEARIMGTGSRLYIDIINSPTPASGVLKSYECYVTATPLMRISFFLANRMIAKLAEKKKGTAATIHVIDFGIFHGYQWPSLIQQLSEIPTGPPRLKITGIEYPEHGFRPARTVEETGRRLAVYCKRFNVPFEYHAVAKKWELIRREDIKLEEGEVVVANCQYRSTNLLDETTAVDCPRDGFLRLIRSLKPDLFVHGIINGTFSAPFFITRFRESLFHFISMFDMFEATMSAESEGRRMIEENLHGKQILNVVASEGVERMERPESYKQWQVRTLRTGFRARRLDKGVVDRIRAIVNKDYHKDFVIDEDGNWLLYGWKGRILFAVSCWRPD